MYSSNLKNTQRRAKRVQKLDHFEFLTFKLKVEYFMLITINVK